MPELAMFPLGTVLFPHMVLPLHVFEPRYRALMDAVLAGDREFGVVLISRGHEVGGGDLRTDVGTVARILQAEQLEDGRWVTITVGTRRFRIERWLPDDPFPRAEVAYLDDEHTDADLLDARERIAPRLRRVLALRAELGEETVPSTFDLAEDAEVACWQPAVLAPLTAFDAQRLLVLDRCAQRLDLLEELLTDLEQTLGFRLGQGG